MTPERTAGEVVELELPPRPEVVSVARLVVGSLAAADPLFDEERSADLRLAVSEACTNAIQAHLERRVESSILLRCVLGEGTIVVEVTDHGGGFDPDDLEEHPAVTDPARLEYEGGLGVPLLRMLSDELDFAPAADGTRVRMVFRSLPQP